MHYISIEQMHQQARARTLDTRAGIRFYREYRKGLQRIVANGELTPRGCFSLTYPLFEKCSFTNDYIFAPEVIAEGICLIEEVCEINRDFSLWNQYKTDISRFRKRYTIDDVDLNNYGIFSRLLQLLS
ncbi:MAG: hypothetical protein ACOCXG_02360 [Nanoarchaeota archaeon]